MSQKVIELAEFSAAKVAGVTADPQKHPMQAIEQALDLISSGQAPEKGGTFGCILARLWELHDQREIGWSKLLEKHPKPIRVQQSAAANDATVVQTWQSGIFTYVFSHRADLATPSPSAKFALLGNRQLAADIAAGQGMQ
jgi:hypothetical protein